MTGSADFEDTLEQWCDVWVFSDRSKDQGHAEMERRRREKNGQLHCKQALPVSSARDTHESQAHKENKKVGGKTSHSQMDTQSMANVRRTHMAARSPVKRTQQQEHNGLTEGFVCRESQQMSLRHVISRDIG